MQIVVFDARVGPADASRFAEHELKVFDYRVPSADAFVELARYATAIGVRRIPGWACDRSVVERLPELQFIHKSGTGLDWLDLSALNEHGVLVHVARGPIVEVEALYQALIAGGIRAASVDVFATEPPDLDHPFFKLENVIATPHIAGFTANQVGGLLDNLELFSKGQRPLRLANPEILTTGTARARHLIGAVAEGSG